MPAQIKIKRCLWCREGELKQISYSVPNFPYFMLFNNLQRAEKDMVQKALDNIPPYVLIDSMCPECSKRILNSIKQKVKEELVKENSSFRIF